MKRQKRKYQKDKILIHLFTGDKTTGELTRLLGYEPHDYKNITGALESLEVAEKISSKSVKKEGPGPKKATQYSFNTDPLMSYILDRFNKERIGLDKKEVKTLERFIQNDFRKIMGRNIPKTDIEVVNAYKFLTDTLTTMTCIGEIPPMLLETMTSPLGKNVIDGMMKKQRSALGDLKFGDLRLMLKLSTKNTPLLLKKLCQISPYEGIFKELTSVMINSSKTLSSRLKEIISPAIQIAYPSKKK